MIGWLLASLLTATGINVQVEFMDGSAQVGQLIAVSTDEVVVSVEGREQQWSAGDLLALRPGGLSPLKPDETQGDLLVYFRDRSRVRGKSFRVEQGRATILLPQDSQVLAGAKTVHSVIFREQNAALRRQWEAIADRESTADVIVIRKTSPAADDGGAERIETVLDYLEGILGNVSETHVQFQFDGTQVDVPREKVEGLLYYRPPAESPPAFVCQIEALDGSLWKARTMSLEDDRLSFVTAGGVRGSVSLAELRALNYAPANLTYLSELTPERLDWRPHLLSPATPPSLNQWFRPRLVDQPVILRGQSYRHGVTLHSRTELTFRLQSEYRRFQSLVGIDDRFRGPGNVRLVISADRNVLFDQQISGEQEPVPIDLDISNARRLTILVDFGADQTDWGDHLNLAEPKLTR